MLAPLRVHLLPFVHKYKHVNNCVDGRQWLITQMVELVTADPRVHGSNPAKVHH